MKTMIVAVDKSSHAQNALTYAASLAKLTKARIVLFHLSSLYTKPGNATHEHDVDEEAERETRKQLELMAVAIRNQFGIPVAYYTKCCIGEEINSLAQQLEADMIIMGVKRKPENNNDLDKITSSVIRDSDFPVFVVPDGATFTIPRRILFACDYQSVPPSYSLAVIKLLALQFDAEVQIFHVENKPHVAEQSGIKNLVVREIQKMMKGVKHSFNELRVKNVSGGIEKGLSDFEADMLLMSPRKPNFFRSLLHKSLTREMALKGNIPMLALKYS